MTINILGQPYKIIFKNYDEDEAFSRRHIDGYCDNYTHTIVICNIATYPNWNYESKETCEAAQKQTVRHEIVHAFLSESGLNESSSLFDGAWAKNEEMVDWVATQGPKIYKAWQEAEAV